MPERMLQIEAIFHDACDLAPNERAAFLTQACAGDAALRRAVEALLAYDNQAEDFIERPALELAARQIRHESLANASTAEMAAAPPRIGSYDLQALLGKGGMGEVHLAFDQRLQRQIAIKLLPPQFTADAQRVRRFTQEARAASALNHPNILTIHEIGEHEGTHYIVTEYVEGETLRQRITSAPRKQIPLTEALRITTQMTEALAAAHEAGIIHRDIKPENVMVRKDGYVKILDFGLAKLIEQTGPVIDPQAPTYASLTEAGIVMGTPRYMSPEQARGEKVDVRSDIFSLGVMLYEMIAGQAPFAGTTPSEVIAAILRDEAPPLTTDAPPELQRIIHRALQKKRDERYPTAQDLLTDLRRLQRQVEHADGAQAEAAAGNEQPTVITQSQPLSTDPLTHRQAGLKRWNGSKWLAACALGVILVAVAAWFYFHRPLALTSKDTILLADFENRTGDEIFDEMLKQGLATQLEQSSFLNVFPEARVRQTLRQMERADDTRVTPELAQEICERQNLKAFIVGSMAPLGSHFVITLAALRGSNGEELTRAQATTTSKEQVLQALTGAAAQLRAKLGESLSSIQQSDQPLAQATTSDLRALKTYSEANALMVSGRLIEALPFIRRAAELDRKFISAYDRLTIICFATEQPEAAAAYQAKIIQLAEERAAQAKTPISEYAKLDIATWSHRFITGNLHKSLESALAQRQLAPHFARAQNELGLTYAFLGQSEQALAPLNEAIRLNPNFAAPYRGLALSLLRLNRFAEAKDTLTQALQLKLDMTAYHTQLYQLAFINADAAGMQQQLDWVKGKPDEYIALDWQTGAAAFAGHWQQAQEFSRRAIELAARGENREVAARYATEQALRSAVLGNCPMSKTSAAQGLTFGRGRLPLARAALALALCGATTQAQTLANELNKRFPEDTLSQELWLPAIRAALHLQRGEATQALEQLRNTSRYEAVAECWPQYLRGQAYLKLNKATEAASGFQKILNARGQAALSVLYPLAQLGLAHAAQQSGDRVKARESYKKFFVLWKEAETDLPALLAAKKEYERVK